MSHPEISILSKQLTTLFYVHEMRLNLMNYLKY